MLAAEKIYLSIIIPHYNSVKLLEKLLFTIPNRREIQIIVVDDNSTEGTEELVKLVQTREKQLIFLKNELGKNSAGRCRNIGLQHATGEWILFADADDYFMPDFYQHVSCFFESKSDIVYFLPTSYNLDTNEEGTRHVTYARLINHYLKTKGMREEIELRYRWDSPWSKLIRRKIVEDNDITFDTTNVANDVMFSMKSAYAAQNIEVSDKIIYCITQMEGTLTTALSEEKFYIRFNVGVEKYHFLKDRLTREEWNYLALWGRSYISLARIYGLNRWKRGGVYLKLIKEGMQVDYSKKWTLIHRISQLWGCK